MPPFILNIRTTWKRVVNLMRWPLYPHNKEMQVQSEQKAGWSRDEKDVLEKTVTCCREYSNTGPPSPQSAMLQTKLPHSNYLAYEATSYAVQSLSYRIKGPDFNCRHRQ